MTWVGRQPETKHLFSKALVVVYHSYRPSTRLFLIVSWHRPTCLSDYNELDKKNDMNIHIYVFL